VQALSVGKKGREPQGEAMKKPEKKNQLEIAKKFCLLQPCEILKDEATGGCYACKIGTSIKNTFAQAHDICMKYHNSVVEKMINEGEMHAIFHKASGLEITLSIARGLKAIVKKLKELSEQTP
jgi:hypothetical protein